LNELHVEGAGQVGQFPLQNQATPRVADFGNLDIVLVGEGRNHREVLLRGSVLKGKLVTGEVLSLMRQLQGHAVQMFTHGVMRGSRPQHEGYSSLLVEVHRHIHYFAAYEMIDFTDRNVLFRSHGTTYGFLNLQSL